MSPFSESKERERERERKAASLQHVRRSRRTTTNPELTPIRLRLSTGWEWMHGASVFVFVYGRGMCVCVCLVVWVFNVDGWVGSDVRGCLVMTVVVCVFALVCVRVGMSRGSSACVRRLGTNTNLFTTIQPLALVCLYLSLKTSEPD